MNDPVGWGILGGGRFARRRMLPAFARARGARVVALQRRQLSEAQAAAQSFGVPKAYARREDLLADPEVQAVLVATHNAAHRGDVIAAAEAGKHVLVEKPMGLNALECLDMIAAARQAGVRLFAGHCFRYTHAVERAKAWLAEGALGALEALRGHYSFLCKKGAWRWDSRLSGGGPLMDLAPHLIDFFRYLTGEEIVEVNAMVEPDLDEASGQSEARARALLKLSGGALAELAVSFREPFRNGFELFGSAGSLRGDYTLSLIENPHVRLERFASDPQPPRVETLPLERRDIYRLEIEDVSRAISDPAHTPRCASGGDGQRALAVIDAIYESGRSGRREKVVLE